MAIDMGIKILVVDDFSTMRKIVQSQLKELGFSNMSEADSGASAWKMIEEEKDYQFIVTDWNMPEMTGLDLLKKIRAHETYKTLPVLLVTAEAKKEQIVTAAQAGVNGYVLKPFTKEDLKGKIEKIFKCIL